MTKGVALLERKLICSDCGVQSQRWGKCWEMGKCAGCIKQGYLTCKECGAKSNNVTAMCWKENLCGLCFRRKDSPKKFNKNKLCFCGEILVSMRYIKRGINVNTGFKVCTKCSVVFNVREKYRMASLR